ncbi:ABC transporter ATP-binding protein [Marihabitans asiaticum]|uniref:Branched-chain amino acid transport system ATP-binding protein n=1 Tax=Marihabitans asiaticum TaxID=415218 RepID=A0A560W9P2_9MICO|nr:ABC transporter ATP-binding protein [Marihabitans asiaticum]TWD14346.1 branched-chain amino acid transport system ATP-binding protein [Marihabitans asiaticum]
MLELDGVTSRYGPVTALQDVDLVAEAGRITAVLGANGAGKTTLLRTISGLHRADAGTIRFDGRDITRLSTDQMTRAGMAHVPEGRGVITELTVKENLRLGALGRSTHRDAVSIDDVVDLFPILGDRSNALAHTLSGGERQMLVIGRALLATPKMLLLDEPSLGLAPRIVSQIFGVIRQLVHEQGLTVLLVEQNARSALSIADVGVVLGLGKVVAQDDAAILAADENLRHAYLGY